MSQFHIDQLFVTSPGPSPHDYRFPHFPSSRLCALDSRPTDRRQTEVQTEVTPGCPSSFGFVIREFLSFGVFLPLQIVATSPIDPPLPTHLPLLIIVSPSSSSPYRALPSLGITASFPRISHTLRTHLLGLPDLAPYSPPRTPTQVP